MKKEKLLGIETCITNYDEIISMLNNDIINCRKVFVVAINPEKIMRSRKDAKLKNILNSATYQIPDGIGVLYASKINNGSIVNRITGIDLMEKLCLLSSEKEYKIFLYGAQCDTLLLVKKALKDRYENLNIVGAIDGFDKNINKVIKTINKKKPDILFVALGSPKQEYFIYNNLDKLNCKVFMGVGGSFDVISGKVKRAPIWMQEKGLEWLYRLLKNPKRIIRQIKLVPFFFISRVKK